MNNRIVVLCIKIFQSIMLIQSSRASNCLNKLNLEPEKSILRLCNKTSDQYTDYNHL